MPLFDAAYEPANKATTLFYFIILISLLAQSSTGKVHNNFNPKSANHD